MDIPNLSQTEIPPKVGISKALIAIIAIIAIGFGFGASRLQSKVPTKNTSSSEVTPVSADQVKSASDVKVGAIYGDVAAIFKDSAVGKVEKGNINGEGTHILVREGGLDQRASLTSSVIDLDLFVGRKVEVKGQTNASTKTGWLLDVGWLKVLE